MLRRSGETIQNRSTLRFERSEHLAEGGIFPANSGDVFHVNFGKIRRLRWFHDGFLLAVSRDSRITSTEQCACMATASETLPSISLSIPR